MASLDELEGLVPEHLKIYLDFMKAFRDVVDKCLRMRLAEDWEVAINTFSTKLDLMKETFDMIEGVKFHIMRVSSAAIS